MYGFIGHEDLFVGQDPFDIERHYQVLTNLDFHYGRCWPLDLASWDLMGKAVGLPVYKLLGARSSRILAYASTAQLLVPEARAQQALSFLEQGFRAIKIRFHHPDPRDDIKVIDSIRQAVGDRMEIMVGANQGWKMPPDTDRPWDLKTACQVARMLEDLGVYWLEEPLLCHDFRGLGALRQMVGLRIAGGEMNRNWYDFREMNYWGSLDV
jgi:D-galactarolactone cycloisomerase